MPRQPKPFFRKQTSSWYVTLAGRQISLGRDKDAAFLRYHELMAARGDAAVLYTSVAQLLDAHLTLLEANRLSGTYKKALHYLQSFAEHAGRVTLQKLAPAHLMTWVEGKSKWSDTTRHDAISTVQRAFNWAVKRGHIGRDLTPKAVPVVMRVGLG